MGVGVKVPDDVDVEPDGSKGVLKILYDTSNGDGDEDAKQSGAGDRCVLVQEEVWAFVHSFPPSRAVSKFRVQSNHILGGCVTFHLRARG